MEGMRAQFRSLANTGERAQEEVSEKMMSRSREVKKKWGWELHESQGRGNLLIRSG